MHDARDEEDRRLLEAGEHALLMRAYYETILQRCYARCRTRDDAHECAHGVVVRLLSELKRGRHYAVPFRIVVHKVIEWTTRGFYAGGTVPLAELPEDIVGQEDPIGEAEVRYDLERALGTLPEGDREVARMRLVDGLEIADIAARLGKTRNAVDQALHRARGKLEVLFE
jgi:RNA polymerase sigma factor (sigma-70 family)